MDMSYSYLPPELLLEIFQYMKSKDIIECRNVCQRWKLVVDGLKDEFWREICKRDHNDVYKEAYRKARLSWRELCRTLDLWSEVATADVTVQKIPDIGINSTFRILGNGILACTGNTDTNYKRLVIAEVIQCNAIAYFDLLTLKEIRWENFDFKFCFYDENDQILVVQRLSPQGIIRIMPKTNKENYIEICALACLHGGGYRQWALNGNKVYYLSDCNKLRCVKLIEDNNGITWENVIVANSYIINHFGDTQYIESLESVVDINNTQINILTSEVESTIYSLVGGELKEICTLDRTCDQNHIELIFRHNFRWISQRRFLHSVPDDEVPFDIFCVYFYGNIAIVIVCISHNIDEFKTDYEKVLRIYNNPFGEDGRLNLYKSELMKSIELPKDYLPIFDRLDVIETRNGHKILISYRGMPLVFDLEHKVSGTYKNYSTGDQQT